MDIKEYKKIAKNKIEADALTKQVRDVIKTTKWEKQNMREGFKETFKPLIKSQDSIKKSIDQQQDANIAQLKANQLALTQGINQNRLAITEGFDKMDEVKRWDLAQLPGFEAIEEPKEDEEYEEAKEYEEEEEQEQEIEQEEYEKEYEKKYGEAKEVLPSTSDEKPKIAKFKPEDLDRYLLNKEAQEILKDNGYKNLSSYYLEEDVSTIKNTIKILHQDLERIHKVLKNTAYFIRDPNGYKLAKPISKNPHERTSNYISSYNVINIYETNLSNLKYYKTKSGSGIVYFNNPHQLLDRLELLGGSILAGNNGVIPEFSQIAHLLKKMKVISKKQLNDLLKII